MFKVHHSYITDIFKELRDDPVFRMSYKPYFTCIISFTFLISSLLSANTDLINRVRNYNKTKINLYVNTPYIPQEGKAAVLKKSKKEQKRNFIEECGKRYRMHYFKETITLYAYPLFALQEAFSTLRGIIEEREQIRSPFRYVRKILQVIMARERKRPFWYLYYRELSKHGALPNSIKGKAMSTDNAEKPEMSKPICPKKYFPKALLGKAKSIWELAQKGRCSAFKARRELAQFKQAYPEGIDNFNEWYNSADGLGFRAWITQK